MVEMIMVPPHLNTLSQWALFLCLWCSMNWLIWNCRGAGDNNFPGLMRDCIRIYNLSFVAILEPRISGVRADSVVNRLGMDGMVRVEANGFSGGIWCLWKQSSLSVDVVSSSCYCIHLKIGPHSASPWYMSVVYASPQAGMREAVWEELTTFAASISLPWCVGGDFNSVLFAHEKEGGAPFNYNQSIPFSSCINSCNLLDLGFNGPPFTWSRGQLRERLDRILCNEAWQSLFPLSSVTHLSLPSSVHCGLWLRLDSSSTSSSQQGYFKLLGPCIDHPDFRNQVKRSWQQSSYWEDNISRLTSSLKIWNKVVFGNIFNKKHRLLRRMEGINRILLTEVNPQLQLLRDKLWDEYLVILHQEEAYWFHQAKSKWILLGDRNTRFFHQTAIVRQRKKFFLALQNNDGAWMYDEEDLRNMVVDFYSQLYATSGLTFYNLVSSHGFPILSKSEIVVLSRSVSMEETKRALFSMKNYKSPGPDGYHPLFFKS